MGLASLLVAGLFCFLTLGCEYVAGSYFVVVQFCFLLMGCIADSVELWSICCSGMFCAPMSAWQGMATLENVLGHLLNSFQCV